jgi:hypothetical protein
MHVANARATGTLRTDTRLEYHVIPHLPVFLNPGTGRSVVYFHCLVDRDISETNSTNIG